jgi:hypothetical protein
MESESTVKSSSRNPWSALSFSAQVSGLAQFERQAQGIERSPPVLAVGKRSAKDRQTIGFQIAVASALVSDISGRRGAIEQQRFLAIIARLDLQDSTAEPQPACGIVGSNSDELTKDQHACTQVILLERGVGIAMQRCCGLGHRASITFYLRLKLDRRLIERALLESLLGRYRRGQNKNQQCGGKARANDAKHGEKPTEETDRGKYYFSS